MKVLLLTVVALLLVAGWAEGQGCAPYQKFAGHTMCLYKEKACPGFKLLARGLTAAQKGEVVSAHNKLRQSLVNGQVAGQPRALSMATLVWDEELATIAQRMADQCKFQHDTMRNVDRFYVGQNIHGSSSKPVDKNTSPNMSAATTAWFNEVYSPGFNPKNISPFVSSAGAGHYTQVAWAETKTIGCGYVMFENNGWSTKNVYCNYGPGGNMQGGRMYVVKK